MLQVRTGHVSLQIISRTIYQSPMTGV